jgi:hypothetical protein
VTLSLRVSHIAFYLEEHVSYCHYDNSWDINRYRNNNGWENTSMQTSDEASRKKSVMLVPQEVREVNFYGDLLLVALVDDVAYVALRPIVEFLGAEWAPQYQRLQRDEVLDEERRLVVMTGADGRQREMVSLPLEFLPGWLFGIVGSRLKDAEKAQKLKRYRRECFRALWREFGQSAVASVPASAPTSVLVQVRDLGLAVVQMAEEQMVLQGQVEAVTLNVDRAHTRLDRAAVVVGDLQRRLSSVERRVVPTSVISEEQAAEISVAVKALAELISGKDTTKNHYQGIFGELYRRYGISSYKLIRQEDYQAVQQFLEDWRQSLL